MTLSMIIHALKWLLYALTGAGIFLIVSACTPLGLNYASLAVDNKPEPGPALLLPLDPAQIRDTLSKELYGLWAEGLSVSAGSRRILDAAYLDGRGTLQAFDITLGEGPGALTFPVILAVPHTASERPVPLIISQTFADNCSVFPNDPVPDGYGGRCNGPRMSGLTGFIATGIFGSYIAYAPIERYLDAGLAYASLSGPTVIPDNRHAARMRLKALDSALADTGTLIVWAKAFAAIASVLQDDPHIQPDAIAAFGHSRYGKSALIAAAYSDDIDAAIAHQSGFAGSASSRSRTGETLARMASSYPHWLRDGLAQDLNQGFELSYDQHFLLALIAPKPILLGNGRRDVWSDPNSTYRIARAAEPAYQAGGSDGLAGAGMRDFMPGSDIAYWLRVGGHSLVSEDIDAFIAFMRAHFID